VTELLTDGTRNALPGNARVLGDARSFRPEVSATIGTELRRITEGIAASYDLDCEASYSREFVPTINDPEAAAAALAAAEAVLESENVREAAEPNTGSEDFARFLQHVRGCFAFIGNGETPKPLHNPEYDFNDDALRHGTSFFVQILRDGIFWPRPPVDERRAETADDRARASRPVGGAAVRARVDQPIGVLLPARGRDGAEPGADAADRRAVPGNAVVWLEADGEPSPARGLQSRPQAGSGG